MEKEIAKQGEVLLYSDDSGKEFVNVIFKDETFWLTPKAMAELFDVNVPAISKHLQNIYEDGELERTATISKMETVQQEGQRQVKRAVDHYNLDAIIAVGYRVNSKKATRFCQWATSAQQEGIYNEIMLSADGIMTVYCPVADYRVDGDTCLEITVVADREIKASVLPDTIVWNEEQREKCLHCKWHWT